MYYFSEVQDYFQTSVSTAAEEAAFSIEKLPTASVDKVSLATTDDTSLDMASELAAEESKVCLGVPILNIVQEGSAEEVFDISPVDDILSAQQSSSESFYRSVTSIEASLLDEQTEEIKVDGELVVLEEPSLGEAVLLYEGQHVGEQPLFTQSLQKVEVQEGSVTHFEAVVHGVPYPDVSWFHDGEVIMESAIYHITTKENGMCILELPQSLLEDAGEYECRATNIIGTASTKAELCIAGELLFGLCFLCSVYTVLLFHNSILVTFVLLY